MSLQRLSELCCSAVSQLLMLGKSIISNANKVQAEDMDADLGSIDWPEDSVEKAKIIRSKAQAMTGYVEAVSSSFITGWLPGALLLLLCGHTHDSSLFTSFEYAMRPMISFYCYSRKENTLSDLIPCSSEWSDAN